jgi:hypothetical protein
MRPIEPQIVSIQRLAALSWSLLALTPLTAQRIALPHATGGLRPSAEWTVLQRAELDAEQRPSDPADEPARSLLSAAVGDLRTRQRTAEHVLLHSRGGATGELRLVNAYSADGGAAAAEVLAEPAVAKVRAAFEPTLAAPGITVSYLGHGNADLFVIPSLVLRFQLDGSGRTWQVHHHVVPAGKRIQYFETLHFTNDASGQAAIDALLRSFDGAREGGSDPILRNMLLGGAAGALAGVMAAMLRRRRQQRRLLAEAAPARANAGQP